MTRAELLEALLVERFGTPGVLRLGPSRRRSASDRSPKVPAIMPDDDVLTAARRAVLAEIPPSDGPR